jgi:hydrogenase nickel incorporation protein HypA/HybF
VGLWAANLESRVHELSVCQALLAQVDEIARQNSAAAVSRVLVEVGPLCGVEPNLLMSAFAVMCSRSIASGAELLIESTAVTVACLACGVRTETRANRLACAACGGFRTQVVAGDELRLLRVEMRGP